MPRNVKPDEKLVADLTKAIDKHMEANPEGHTSVVLASLTAVFHLIWKLLPRASRKPKEGSTGYTIAATLPKVQLEKTRA